MAKGYIKSIFANLIQRGVGRTKLSDLQVGVNKIVPNEYGISIPLKRDYIVITIGLDLSKPAAQTHYSNCLAYVETTHEFKHSNRHGNKWWTSKRGLDLYFAINTEYVEIFHDKGYSYPRVLINNIPAIFNVSGGSGNGEVKWIDMLTFDFPINVGHINTIKNLRDLNRIALSQQYLKRTGRWDEVVKPIISKRLRDGDVWREQVCHI